MLLLGDYKLFGPEEGEELSFVVRDTGCPLVSVVGRPSEDAIRGPSPERRDTRFSYRRRTAPTSPPRCPSGTIVCDAAPAR
jgi:hypothetical protein